MPEFRKKPIIVKAEQWFPKTYVEGVKLSGWSPDAEHLGYVVTIHGQKADLAPGDWVITEPDGVHHYPCKPDIFAATYEPVDHAD